MEQSAKASIGRYRKDVECYHLEIEELNNKIKNETDTHKVKHYRAMLLETQRALSVVLGKIDELEDLQEKTNSSNFVNLNEQCKINKHNTK